MTAQSKERRKGRSTAGRVHGIRFDWDAHGAEGYAVDVQERSHEDSGDLIAAKIRRDWSQESEGAEPAEAAESQDEPAEPAEPAESEDKT